MIALVLNGACVGVEKGNLAALLDEKGKILAQEFLEGRTGSNLFPGTVSHLLKVIAPHQPGRLAVIRGPGSFTGLRSSLALAKGLAMGWKCPLIGVSLGEALRCTIGNEKAVIISLARRGRVFVDFPGEGIQSVPVETAIEMLHPDMEILAGDALAGLQKNAEIIEKASLLGIKISTSAFPSPQGIADAASTHSEQTEWLPLYIDPPKISRPAVGMRPPPVAPEGF